MFKGEGMEYLSLSSRADTQELLVTFSWAISGHSHVTI